MSELTGITLSLISKVQFHKTWFNLKLSLTVVPGSNTLLPDANGSLKYERCW
ncbi:MAG: hypothetical protein MUE64_07655 [Ignavibacteriaceae bacterium]|nr:hypothetical protein [Ignavibacteriaceae bacterium]